MLQQPLPLYKTADKTFDAFIVGNNALAFSAVKKWARKQGPWFLLLWGEAGVGKSHLIQAALREANDAEQAMYLPLRDVDEVGPEILEELDSLSAVGIDDVEQIVSQKAWETALFSFFNTLQEHGGRLLLTTQCNPRFAAFHLADLQSRLCSGLSFQLVDLSDEQKKSYLLECATQRDLDMPVAVAEYIVNHHGRNLHDLSALFERLDRANLVAGRALTVPFVKTVIAEPS